MQRQLFVFVILTFSVMFSNIGVAYADTCIGGIIHIPEFVPKPGIFYIKSRTGKNYIPSANCLIIPTNKRAEFSSFHLYITNTIEDGPALPFVAIQHMKEFSGPVMLQKLKIGRSGGWFLPDVSGNRILQPAIEDKSIRTPLAEWNNYFGEPRQPTDFNNLIGEKWVAFLGESGSAHLAEFENFWVTGFGDEVTNRVIGNNVYRFDANSDATPNYMKLAKFVVQDSLSTLVVKTHSNIPELDGQKLEFRFE